MLCVHPLLPPIGHSWDVMLVWRKGNIREKLLLCYCIVYCYNGAQSYEQFLQVSVIWASRSRQIVPEMTYNVSSGTLNHTYLVEHDVVPMEHGHYIDVCVL